MGRGQAALRTEGDGDVNIELDGDNYLKSSFASHAAGLNKGNSGTLTINDEDNNGKLEATGGYGGAGIGGGQHSSASDITITGGTITARGSNNGAGIGGGASDINGPYCNGSNITISGGDVTAIGSVYASGIGGGSIGSGSDITISGGKVTAKGGDQGGAGIGGGIWPAAAISRSRVVKLKPPAAALLPGLAAAMAATGPTSKFPAAKSPQKAA